MSANATRPMNNAPGRPLRDPNEHRAVTLGDLAAVVAGVAVVLVLPSRQSYWPLPTDFLGPWPRWLPWFFCLRQILGAACIALVPVILRRRASYGGLARPAEFLAICAAMPFLADSIETGLIRLSYRLDSGISLPGYGVVGMATSFLDEWGKSSHWVWEHDVLIAGVMSLVVFILGRRKLPGWLLTALLSCAWLAAYEPGTRMASRWVFRVIAHVNGQPTGEPLGGLISAAVYSLPRFVLYAVTAIAAVYDISHARSARPTWLEWTCLGLAAAVFLIAEPTELVRYFSQTSGREWAMHTLIRVVTLITALVVSFFLTLNGKRGGRRIGF
jgi:hypothetical protein